MSVVVQKAGPWSGALASTAVPAGGKDHKPKQGFTVVQYIRLYFLLTSQTPGSLAVSIQADKLILNMVSITVVHLNQ